MLKEAVAILIGSEDKVFIEQFWNRELTRVFFVLGDSSSYLNDFQSADSALNRQIREKEIFEQLLSLKEEEKIAFTIDGKLDSSEILRIINFPHSDEKNTTDAFREEKEVREKELEILIAENEQEIRSGRERLIELIGRRGELLVARENCKENMKVEQTTEIIRETNDC